MLILRNICDDMDTPVRCLTDELMGLLSSKPEAKRLQIIEGGRTRERIAETDKRKDLLEALEFAETWLALPKDGRRMAWSRLYEEERRAKECGVGRIIYDEGSGLKSPHTMVRYMRCLASLDVDGITVVVSGIIGEERAGHIYTETGAIRR